MKAGRYFALITGVTYLLIGLLGFIPGLVSQPAVIPEYIAEIGVISGLGDLFGIFPVNTAANVVHIVVGIMGIAASIALDSSRWYAGVLSIICWMLTIMGMIPVARTVFGLFPIYGGDILLHAVTAAFGVYFGFFATPNLLQLFRGNERVAREEFSQ